MSESDSNSNSYLEQEQQIQHQQVQPQSDNDSNNIQQTEEQQQEQPQQEEEEEEDIDIDAGNDADDLFGSDADENNADNQQEEADDNLMEDLFGSDDDANDENQNDNTKIEVPQYQNRNVPDGKKIHISSSTMLSDLPSPKDFEFCMLRLPNVIGCETDAFDERSYIAPSTSSSIDNCIRWRTHYETATDETYKESNTRLVYWKDGTKSLIIGKDCYDIDEQPLNTVNRDFLYAQLDKVDNCGKHTQYKLCHSKFVKKLNVRTTTNKSYKTLQKNLAKKHERTKGSKQLTALQRRNNRSNYQYQQQQRRTQGFKQKNRINKKRNFNESWLEQGGHGNSSDDGDYHDHSPQLRKKTRRSSESSSSNESEDDEDDDDDSDSDEEDDKPIGSRLR